MGCAAEKVMKQDFDGGLCCNIIAFYKNLGVMHADYFDSGTHIIR